MRCFRLSHAGLVVEHERSSLFVDPGDFTADSELGRAIESSLPIAGVVITHEHADHWTPANVAALREAAPTAPIFTTAATARSLGEVGIADVEVVGEGGRAEVGPFSLEFYGRTHEMLHSSIPVIENVGVRVDEALAWGGDSLTRPPFYADVLGVPIGSPWSNISQVMDFVLRAAPRRAFLTHDGMLSGRGRALFTQRVQWCLGQVGGELIELPRLDEDPAARLLLDDASSTRTGV